MLFSRAVLRRLVPLVMTAFFVQGRLSSQIFHVSDISPNTPYGIPANASGMGADTGGRTIQIIVDPTSDNIVYLASDIAGVWKSTDGAQHWVQASAGIQNPMTSWANGRHPLGIDATNPQRLLYATSDDDLRVGHPWGGLYYSATGAALWQHIDLPNCPDPAVGDVLFLNGTAYVSTRCGLFTGTGNLTQPANWIAVAFPTTEAGWLIAVSGTNQFACRHGNVYRRTSSGWSLPIAIAGDCWGITLSPDVPDSQVYAIDWSDFLSTWEIQLVDFATNTHTLVGNRLNPDACCGQGSIWTVRRPHGSGTGPGHSFDIFGSNMFRFYQYDAATSSWKIISTVHVDTFTMGFPSSYDPDQGNCTAYMTNDGGVHKNLSSGPGCALWDGAGQWVDAMSGLHTMFGYTISVLPQASSGGQPRAAIYLPTGDNETWGTLDGGVTWQDMGCCGDSGKAVIDPALPQQMVTMRNGFRRVYRSSGATPPVATDTNDNMDLIAIPNSDPNTYWTSYEYDGKSLYDGAAPPQQGAFAQVMTLSGETVEAQGDYMQAAATFVLPDYHTDPNATNDIIRTTTGTRDGWRSISSHFMENQIGSIQPSGGHTNTVVYVMTGFWLNAGTGLIFRGQVDGDASTGNIPDSSWQQLPFPGEARALYVNPYDPNVLFAMDITAGVVRSSGNGGQGWREETDLTRILTRNHEFITTFNPDEGFRQTNYSCTLNSVYFDRNDPNLRAVASVTGALAFSRDGGLHWMSLNDAIDPNVRPSSVVYDSTINPQTNTPSLYYNALNRSMSRIDAPFPTLETATYELRGLGPGHAVMAVDATTAKTTALSPEADGVYRGYDDVFDSAVFNMLSYHFVIDGQPSAQFTHTLTVAEKTSGAVLLARAATGLSLTGDISGEYDDPVAFRATLTTENAASGIVGKTLSFSLGNQSCQAATDANGSAGCTVIPNQKPGTYTLTVSFAGDNDYLPATLTQSFALAKEEATVRYSGPSLLAHNSTVTFSATLKEDDTVPIQGRTVSITIGSGATTQSCSGVTDGSGSASCNLTISVPQLGPAAVSVYFIGDDYYRPSSDLSQHAIVFAWPAKGAFVIGDTSAEQSLGSGTTVLFWGSTWHKDNILSQGAASAAFKGFAEAASTALPDCGGTWIAAPGLASPGPPVAVPSYMGVIVTSAASGPGSNRSLVEGNIVNLAVLATGSGGEGTGKVVAIFCK